MFEEITQSQSRRRETDKGFLCLVALRMSQLWDFIQKRQIDKHILTAVILYGSWSLGSWSMQFAYISQRPGSEIALIIAAVTGPYAIIQTAAINYAFKVSNS